MFNVLPSHNDDRSTYNLRNADDLANFFTRTELFANSFFPSTIRLWNSLPDLAKNAQSLNMFKSFLYSNVDKPPSYFYTGNRYEQILHTRLRLECSSLNDHLYKKSITECPNCICGERETNCHFLLKCPLYNGQRRHLLSDLPCPPTTKILLFGSSDLNDQENKKIFQNVQTYIVATKRF